MSKKVNYIPENYHSITPYLYIRNASKAIDFYKDIFGAAELFRMEDQGRIGHAELKIGNSIIMLSDENSEINANSPKTIGGTPIGLMLYVEDVDKVVESAAAKGASIQMPVEDKFYGDRMGAIQDPFGFIWFIATHIEDVSPEELQKRMAEVKQ